MVRFLTVLCVLPALAGAQEVDSSETRLLGPARDVAVLAFPLDALIHAGAGAPRLAIEVRIALSERLALAVRPIGVWFVPTADREAHGGGGGAAIGVQWFLERPLAGPYVSVQAGDVEVSIDGEGGRFVGGDAVFGYALSWEGGAQLSLGVGFGYWHRMGVVDRGLNFPDVLSLRVGIGWGFGHDDAVCSPDDADNPDGGDGLLPDCMRHRETR